MPYGWRTVRAWLLGLALASIWFVPYWLFWKQVDWGEFPRGIGDWGVRHGDMRAVPRVSLLIIVLVVTIVLPRPIRPFMPSMLREGRVTAWVLLVVALLVIVVSAPSAYWMIKTNGHEILFGHGSWDRTVRYDDGDVMYRATIRETPDGRLIETEEWPGDSSRNDEWEISSTPRLDALKVVTMLALNFLLFCGPTLLLLTGPPWLCYRIEMLKENPTLRRWFLGGRGGSSRWAGPATLARHEREDHAGVYMGRSLFEDDFHPRPIAIEDDTHLLTIGMPGSGKSITSIWPNLLSYQGSLIVIDPKGEHAKMTLGSRQDKSLFEQGWGTNTEHITRCPNILPGGAAWVLDPFGVVGCYESSSYNVISEIDITDNYARQMISAISKSCITVHEGENKFWEESARQVLDGAIAHVLSTRPEGERNLPAVADMLLGIDPVTGFADEERLKDTLIDMRMNAAVGGLPQRAAMLFDNLGPKAYGIITAELLNALKWCSDPAMRKCLTGSAFRFGDITHGTRYSIYIALPFAAMTEQARWLRCVTEIAMQAGLRNRERNPRPQPPVLFVLDELPQYGQQLQGIKEGMVTLRDAGMKLWPFVQNIKQLVECFGEEGAKNFESGATIQVYGVNDAATAGWVSTKLGSHGITRKTWKRWKWLFFRKTVAREEAALVDPTAITRELQKSIPLQYVFPVNGAPMRLARTAFKALDVDGSRFRGSSIAAERADEHLLS